MATSQPEAETIPRWLAWAREIQSLTQSGLTFCQNPYDVARYRRLEEIAAEIVAAHTTLPQEAVLESFRVQPGYATPKVDVRAAVLRDGKILLVQERSDGGWTMPGGWADVGEAPSAVAVREVREESGFTVTPGRLIAVHDANRRPNVRLEFYHAYKLVFLCVLAGGEATPSDETSAVDFFDLAHIPPLSTYRTSRQMIEEAYAHAADASLPTVFD
jgi:ADP-ribose pyrophosphatase YjhB (NUDIX family)